MKHRHKLLGPPDPRMIQSTNTSSILLMALIQRTYYCFAHVLALYQTTPVEDEVALEVDNLSIQPRLRLIQHTHYFAKFLVLCSFSLSSFFSIVNELLIRVFVVLVQNVMRSVL
jgi:hypothetical protein